MSELSARFRFRASGATVTWAIAGASLAVVLVVAILLAAPRDAGSKQLDVSGLPRLNAGLNAASAILLSAGYVFIRRGQVKRHRACMLTAFGLSALFLASYVIYHAVAGSIRFAGPDWLRPIYFAVLISHVALAAVVLPLALTTLRLSLSGVFVRHRRIARWTLPIWLYVSVSGVAVYLLLHHVP